MASTEPPTVIGGERLEDDAVVLGVVRFNGAADGDRRRGIPGEASVGDAY